MDKAGPYNLTLLTVQANEIRGISQLLPSLQYAKRYLLHVYTWALAGWLSGWPAGRLNSDGFFGKGK